MKNETQNDREQPAVDALVAASLRQGEDTEVTEGEVQEFLVSEPVLSPAGEAALESLGSSVIRALNEHPRVGEGEERSTVTFAGEDMAHFSAMHRKNISGRNAMETEQELERKRREILTRLRRKKEAGK